MWYVALMTGLPDLVLERLEAVHLMMMRILCLKGKDYSYKTDNLLNPFNTKLIMQFLPTIQEEND